MKLKFSHFDSQLKDIDEASYTVRAVFSTADVDRHGEVVDQKSWILDSYLKNPVILFGHDHNQPPVGKVTGLGYNEDGNLEGTIQFAAKEYEFAKVLWNLYKGGFMRAFSVGFASKTVDVIDGQVVLKDNELYEISTVSVPANAMALAKSKGLNVEPLETKLAKELANVMAAEEVAEHEASCEAKLEKDCPCKEPTAAIPDEVTTDEAPKEEEVVEAAVEEAPEEPVEEETTEVETEEVETKAVETEDKGALADALDEVDEREEKIAKLQNVYDILDAFFNLVWSEETKVEDLPAIISEMGDLLKAEAGDTESSKKLVEEVKAVAALGVTKSAEDLMARVKEGRVLSKTNRTAVENAIEALQKVLEADKPKEATEDKTIDETEVLRANIAEKSRDLPVATPAAGVAVPKGATRAREINKAVRSLLATKRNIKKN